MTGNPFRPDEVVCALELLDAVLSPPPGNTYEARIMVEPDGRAVAYACFGATPMTVGTFDIYWMVTAGELRGQGLGARLLGAVEHELKQRGACTVRIETSSLEGAGGARRFYEKANYAVVGIIADFYRPGDDLVTLAKRLEKA